MQRISLIALALIASTGCIDIDWDGFEMDWGTSSMQDGQLFTNSRGVVIHENGDDAHVGMSGTTCEVDTDWGTVGTDHSVPGSDPVVVEPMTEDGKDKVLVMTDDGVHVVTKDDWWGDDAEDYSVPGAIDTGFGYEEIVVLADDPGMGCTVAVVDRNTGDITDTPVPDSYCTPDADIAVDPGLGGAYVANGEGEVIKVDMGQVEEVGYDGADIVVWDTHAEVLYVATTGSDTVRGLTGEGTELWSVDLGAPVISIEDAGVRQGAVVLIEVGSNNQVIFLDADSGSMNMELELPAGATDIAVSDNGHNIAIIQNSSVLFTEI